MVRIQRRLPDYVDAQAGLCLCCLQIPEEDRFSRFEAHINLVFYLGAVLNLMSSIFPYLNVLDYTCTTDIYPSLVLVQPRKTRPCLIERLLMGCKESNQTNKQTNKKHRYIHPSIRKINN